MVIFKKSLIFALTFYYSITMKAGCAFFMILYLNVIWDLDNDIVSSDMM